MKFLTDFGFQTFAAELCSPRIFGKKFMLALETEKRKSQFGGRCCDFCCRPSCSAFVVPIETIHAKQRAPAIACRELERTLNRLEHRKKSSRHKRSALNAAPGVETPASRGLNPATFCQATGMRRHSYVIETPSSLRNSPRQNSVLSIMREKEMLLGEVDATIQI